ncbi:protein amalgam-like [Schistocerca cancellata]|uniref:protein amalgam-like n=1 Tax=Schistocerca cancellata TaxID=274614 RepID=UPI002118786F|nr:protein amalgam-like [Schistocerca cancellata]
MPESCAEATRLGRRHVDAPKAAAGAAAHTAATRWPGTQVNDVPDSFVARLSRPSLDGDDGYQMDDYANDDDPDTNVSDYEEEKEYTGPPPEFTVQSMMLEAHEGDTVTFPCSWKVPVDDLKERPNFPLMWKNGTSSLIMGAIIATTDKRVQLNGSNLILTDVRPTDRGTYTCEILSNETPMDLHHSLEVFEAPKVAKIRPNKSSIVVEAGEALTLSCEANGYPKPTISWIKKRKAKEETFKGSMLNFEKVAPSHSGEYECTAENTYGKSNPAHVKVVVHYKPKVTAIKESVISGVEYESELECRVDSEPKAKVKWQKDGRLIEPSNDFEVTHVNHIYKLKIRKTKTSDFGIYTCEAENTLGSAKSTIDLTRKPSTPALKKVNHADDGSSVEFEWTLESYAPISKYELQYRNKMNGDWKSESPAVTDAEGNIYTVKHKLSPQPPGEYEVVLVSTNEFGSSRSAPHTFQLTHELGVAEPRGEPEPQKIPENGNNGSETRPRLMALLTVLSLSTFFL